MKDQYQKTKEYIQELEFLITLEDELNGVMVIQKESAGIKNLIIGVAYPILIIEQFIFTVNFPSLEIFKSLLQKNRDIIHGAFVLNETGDKVIFRDTLQLENLDLNELEASLNSLSLLLSEYSDQIIKFSKN